MITTQEFLVQVMATPFSDKVKQEIASMLAGTAELTPELHTQVIERLEQEIDEELEDIEMDPADAAELEKEVTEQLDLLEKNTTEAIETAESQMRELDEMSQKVDILERLHS